MLTGKELKIRNLNNRISSIEQFIKHNEIFKPNTYSLKIISMANNEITKLKEQVNILASSK